MINVFIFCFQRKPSVRLGSGFEDAAEVKKHCFFRNTNWDDVINKRLKAPFEPKLSSELDVSLFDKTFTGSSLADSPMEYTLNEYNNTLFQVCRF